MSIRGKAFIVGAYEHPGRNLPDKTIPQIHAEIAVGALKDAGLSLKDVDGFFSDAMGLGMGVVSMAEYLGLKLSYMDSTESGGSSYLCHVGHAASAIAEGKCKVALVSLAGKGRGGPTRYSEAPELGFEAPFGPVTVAWYALAARRHMYEFGTTSEQLAEIKVAASHHAQYNPDALAQEEVTRRRRLNSPLVADPLHRLDAASITDGGGAVVAGESGGCARPATAEGQNPGSWRGAQAHQQRPDRPDLYRRGVVRTTRVRRSRRDPLRHRLRVDL